MKQLDLVKESIDASNQAPGRVATQVAVFLLGKHRPDYRPHEDALVVVEVSNVNDMKFDRKYTNAKGYRFSKVYYRHSGYPGGLKSELAKDVAPAEILRRAVHNMLPKNKQRKELIKRLVIL